MSTEPDQPFTITVIDDVTPKLTALRATLADLARSRPHLPASDELSATLFDNPEETR